MPLLEVVQTRQISASIRLTDSTATQVDQYAAFIRACADDVVEQALAYVFSKDRDFQDFLKTRKPGRSLRRCGFGRFRLPRLVLQLLRSRCLRLLPLPYPRQEAPDSSISFRGKGTAVLRTGRMLTLHPSEGGVRGDKRMQMYTRVE